jgi:ABC-type multidrug transport system fused ATPase/permease subunit
MKKNIKPREKGSYGTFNNILFMGKSIWKFDKVLIFLLVLPMIAQLGISLIGIYTPKIIIDSLVEKTMLSHLILMIVSIAVGLVLFEILLRFSNNQIFGKSMSHRVSMCGPVNEKSVLTDYENVACKEGQVKRQKAINGLMSTNSGTEAIVKQIASIFKNICGLLVYGAILYTLNPYIALLLIVGAIVNIIVSRHAVNYEHKHKDEYAAIDSKLFYMREQTVGVKGAKDIRIYSMAQWLMHLYRTFIKERGVWNKKIALHKYIPNVVDTVIVLLRDGVAYFYLITRVLNGLPVGDFVLFFGAITGFSLWLAGIAKDITDIKGSSLQIDDVRGFNDMQDKSNHGAGISLPIADELPCKIELRNVSYKYRDSEEYILKNLYLTIEKGEKLAIVGVNGAGKTTIVMLICGLLRPTSGEILLNDKPIDNYNIYDYQTLFSVAFQDALVTAYTVMENVSMTTEEDTDVNKVNSVIELSGLKQKVDSLKDGINTYIQNVFVNDGIELSGGEQQKLILARALYKNAPILILDEPTAALDPIAESELYDQYAEFSKDKTSIYISHRLASTRFCDRIIFLEDGKIVEAGSHNELMKIDGKYSNMFDVQSHYYKKGLEGTA